MAISKETILVVDDSRFQQKVIRELFSEEFNLIEAMSGGECMCIIQEQTSQIDLVLLDLVMPGIDGFEVLRRRQTMQEFLDIPVIVLTTSDSHEIQAQAYELGANDFLTKPLDENTAFYRINNLLRSKNRVKSLIQKYVEFKVKSELDGMTGLFNKSTTLKLVNDVISKDPDKMHALLVVDIDNFKAINDIYGHTVGDHTISVVSNVIISQFNAPDIVGRIGGDEFVVFIEDVESKEDVYRRTEALVQIISEKKSLSIPSNVTVSIGIAFTDGTEKDYTKLFLKSDEALYTSKNAGKSCYSEYGVSKETFQISHVNIAVLSDSRSVLSMIEFASDSQFNMKQCFKTDDIRESVLQEECAALYVDISKESDYGKSILDEIDNMALENIPVIVMCSEGCMNQVRTAASYAFLTDMLYLPLEKGILERRVVKHLESLVK